MRWEDAREIARRTSERCVVLSESQHGSMKSAGNGGERTVWFRVRIKMFNFFSFSSGASKTNRKGHDSLDNGPRRDH